MFHLLYIILDILFKFFNYCIQCILYNTQPVDFLSLWTFHKTNLILDINYTTVTTENDLKCFQTFLDNSYNNVNSVVVDSSCLDHLDVFIDNNYTPFLFKLFSNYLNSRHFYFSNDYVYSINNIKKHTIGVFDLRSNCNISFNNFYKTLVESNYILVKDNTNIHPLVYINYEHKKFILRLFFNKDSRSNLNLDMYHYLNNNYLTINFWNDFKIFLLLIDYKNYVELFYFK